MRKETQQTKIQMWSALFIGAIILNFCVSSVGLGISSGTPLYIKAIGGSNTYSGILLAVYILSAMCGRFLSGRLTDASSRRFVIIVGAALIIVGSMLPLIVSTGAMQFASRILQGLGFACAQTAISAYAADVLPYKRLGEGLGYFGLGQALAMAVGPAFAVWLVSLEYTESLSVGLASIGIAMLVITLFVRYEKDPSKLPLQASYRLIAEKRRMLAGEVVSDKGGDRGEAQLAARKTRTGGADNEVAPVFPAGLESEKPVACACQKSVRPTGFKGFFGSLFEKAALYGSVPAAFFSLATVVFISYAAVYAQEMQYSYPSLFFVAAACTAVLSRLVSSKLIDTFSPTKLLAVPLACGIAALLIITFIHNEAIYYAAGFAYGVCVGMAIPLISMVAIKASPASRYGAANALYFLIYDVGFGAGLVGWGFLLDHFGFTTIFMGSAVSLAISFVAACFLFPRAEKLSQEQTQLRTKENG